MSASSWSVRVYWEDTDASGLVYHASYLRFAERARTEWLRARGFEQWRLREAAGLGFVVRRCAIEFRAPARLDDLLTVETVAGAIGGASVAMHQTIARDRTMLVSLDLTLACIGPDGRPRRLPQNLRHTFDTLHE
jgi:acyl-CoA thioester hydrolase